MIDLAILPVFLVTVLLLAISPGPDLVLITTYASTRGFRSGLMLSIGIFIAGILQTLLVTFGLGKLLEAVPSLALLVKVAGALYLSWLGVNLLLSWRRNRSGTPAVRQATGQSSRRLVCRGLLNNIMNPKALIFFSMFLPQFADAHHDVATQIFLLGTLLSGVVFCINTCFAFSFSKLGSVIGRKLKLGRHIDALLGIIFLGLAARLVTSE
ncbi:Leucine efflux protein [Pseudodesulfovibrio hydrargyri]|uniref:Leucine efflux protein n=1 Tax=Pseudodesulfovibrio hydrargyri TaxID=2125990 RepID=A0A1J5N9L3_9BACT|nr:LysE family translocator [Pseudodesulfovibrio hydrargyri]OIQ49935.1 Leucine efflux protein [Pseudodesulfovibrio hydrargyri]